MVEDNNESSPMSITALRGDERLPLYQRLADLLRQEIVDGVHRPGDRLPSENVIAKEYDLAPGTARQALAQLVGDGFLERAQGKGTFVRRPSFDQSLFRFFRFRGTDGERSVPQSRILFRGIKRAPESVARSLEFANGDDAIYIKRLRLIDDAPVLAEEIWLPLEPFRAFLDVPDEDIGPLLYPIYDKCCGLVVARAEEQLTAESADEETAERLSVSPGDPVIVIDRLARGFDTKPLEWRRSKGRADLFHYHIEIR